MSEDLQKLRYPIGRYQPPSRIDADQIERWINDIEALPADLRRAVKELTATQLDTSYRPGGWTIRQVIHHLPDSHMNSFIRFKWALTEDGSEIKAYFEDRWAELPDYAAAPVIRPRRMPAMMLAIIPAVNGSDCLIVGASLSRCPFFWGGHRLIVALLRSV